MNTTASRHLAFYLENRLWSNYVIGRRRLRYIGAAQSPNIGDWVLFQVIRQALDPIGLVPNPPQIGTDDRSWSNRTFNAVGEIAYGGLGSLDGVLLGGGTLLNDRYFFSKLRQFLKPGLPLFIYGSAVRDPSVEGDYLADQVPVIRHALGIGVRDQHAQRCLAAYNISSEVIGDPVLSIEPPVKRDEPTGIIGVNIGCGGWQYGNQREVIATTAKAVSILNSKGHDVHFFVFHPHDYSYAESVRQKAGLANAPIWDMNLGISEFLRRMSVMDVMVGQRLHAVIIACAYGIPAVSIAYRPKCLNFMESMNLMDYGLRADEISPHWLIETVERVLSSREVLVKDIELRRDHYRSLQRKFANKIACLLAENKRGILPQ